MTPEEAAEKLGITLESLFERAYRKNFGIATSPGGYLLDAGWYKKWGNPPPYVRSYVRALKQEDLRQAMT